MLKMDQLHVLRPKVLKEGQSIRRVARAISRASPENLAHADCLADDAVCGEPFFASEFSLANGEFH
jgi:hypothetical protein